jgi:hypothetical protein
MKNKKKYFFFIFQNRENMSDSKTHVTPEDAALYEARERHRALKESLDRAEKIEEKISQWILEGEENELLGRMEEIDEKVVKWTRRRKEIEPRVEKQRQAAVLSLKNCDAEVHTFKSDSMAYHTVSAEEADRVEALLRALALDYDNLCTRSKARLSDLGEDERIAALLDDGNMFAPEDFAISALKQHGSDAFEMHVHKIQYQKRGISTYTFFTVGHPGLAAAVHSALHGAKTGFTIKEPEKVALSDDGLFTGPALRRLAQAMTPEQIAAEALVVVAQAMKQK